MQIVMNMNLLEVSICIQKNLKKVFFIKMNFHLTKY
ncbi:Uncharacterised protein [Myroides odoratus]|nr:hypothetical protein Myrod_0652 [Myroides odoratus DSM 2801]EKB02719.1 hypothetical protein HMPREF9716_03748 [Myroides odoratus CIP 103059]STZ28751.1 Uncharacterised protein [Myroides odoratus]